MASGYTGNVVPRKGLRVRVSCPPLRKRRGSQVSFCQWLASPLCYHRATFTQASCP